MRALLFSVLAFSILLPAAAQEGRPAELENLLQQMAADHGPPPTALDEPVPGELEAFLAARPSAPPAPPTLPPDLEQAAQQFEEVGVPPIVASPTEVQWPYGYETPTLHCVLGRICTVRLEPGEEITGWSLGDPHGWHRQDYAEGDPAEPTHVLTFQPREEDLRTNTVVVTTRRTYNVELRSTTSETDSPEYQMASFWYPDDIAETRRALRAKAKADAHALQAGRLDIRPLPDPTQLNFDFSVEEPRKRRQRFGWKPNLILSDGHRTFFRLPPVALRSDLPALFEVLPDGSRAPVHAQLHGNWWIAPRALHHAEILLGVGKNRRQMTVRSTGAR